jgi:hypothetical protein
MCSTASTSKPYGLTVTPSTLAAGSSTEFTATFTNLDNQPQDIGSANICAPAGFTVTSFSAPPSPATATLVGDTLELSNLSIAPGAKLSLTIQATAPCTGGVYSWSVEAKQSNDFTGPPGNDFTLTGDGGLQGSITGNCRLVFLMQPADGQVNATLTTTPFNTPAGGSIEVEVLDGNNNLLTSTLAITLKIGPDSPQPAPGALLSGAATVTQNTVAGVASFATLSINLHGIYDLLATSPGIGSATSSSFTIWDTAQPCSAGKLCDAFVRVPQTMSVDVSGTSSSSGFLLVTVGLNALSCGDTFNHAPQITTSTQRNFTSATNKTVVVTIDKSIVNATSNNGAGLYAICYSSPTPFTDVNGNTVTTGLLPDCNKVSGVAPCIQSINKDKAGNILQTFIVPPGDPNFR